MEDGIDLDLDLEGIATLLRSHISIRNRTWMKRVHRDCFIGSDAVDFLFSQGLADSRKDAVSIGKKLCAKKLIAHVTDSHDFRDAYLYYRFYEDMDSSCVLANFNGGNGSGTFLGQGGCKWSFCPHTAHNSYILDIRLAEEIERAVAGASIETRARAFGKLRARVKEQAEVDAPDWILTQSTEVNSAIVSVYQRKRPNGNFKNVKITGLVAENPKSFIAGVMGFTSRKQWESNFVDGIIVEAINLGEPSSPILSTDSSDAVSSPTTPKVGETPSLPKNIADSVPDNIARKTDDVVTFLQTVDLAGVPSKMAIAFLNDPERQHALAHLRKQMMLSNPEECMLCQTYFETNADIRFCPCCAMVSCVSCVSKRVFEVVSRQVVSVCIHCHRESSRIRHPPDAVKNTIGIDSSVHGKWWRPEELGIVDYSSSISASMVASDFEARILEADASFNDKLEITDRDRLNPLVAGLLDEEPTETVDKVDSCNNSISTDGYDSELFGSSPVCSPSLLSPPKRDIADEKMARCKKCGEQIPRDMHSIETHMEDCVGTLRNKQDLSIAESPPQGSPISQRTLGGITRRPDLALNGTRIIYRTSRGDESDSKLVRPREVCAIQDSFVDNDGTCYVYEISVRHCDVRGTPGYITADVLSLLYVARPVKGSKSTSSITIISQVDTHDRKREWFFSLFSNKGKGSVSPRREDLVRELKTAGKLLNILPGVEEGPVTLDDFEFLAVLGRGGFGKVMQVRHKTDKQIYAMKILKKTELRRRRQVERTQTERTILANVRHPFIVCLHYAFQSSEKLYMVMDFVQGGDFFTLMRKFKRLPEDWVRIYIGEIAMALQHLHDMDVVYRDLKPENILLCGDGHLKLTDFGLSRFFETRPPNAEDIIGEDDVVTRSFCGTEQYMSPEMLLQQGHNYRMDWWCLGLIMHEMISAKHPFMGATHYDTLRNMVTKPPTLDCHLSAKAATVTRNLLIKNPHARLCCRSGIKELKTLPFFESVDWDALYNKTIDGPYIPDLRSSLDVSSFETTFTREAPIDSISDSPTITSKSKAAGLLKMFGLGTSDNDERQDVFEGFSFARENLDV